MKVKKGIIIFTFLLFLVMVIAGTWAIFYSGKLRGIVIRKTIKQFTTASTEASVVEKVLGLDSPRTYLILFLNNTELRPAGGFIGSYAVVRFDKGKPELLRVEGTEILDNYAPDSAFFIPPKPLQDYLKIKKWQFRDSNWSPDFLTSVSTSLALYSLEKGLGAKEIDGVIGITPSIMEEILKITGPVKVDGQEFSSENFVEKLEYQVEYGFVKQGIATKDRKNIMADLARVILNKMLLDVFNHWPEYAALLPRMFDEKQIIAYSKFPEEQKIIEYKGWGGRFDTTANDYLLWVDANLGALKTDLSIDRNLSYTLTPSTTGYIAKVTMHFRHQGSYDWRTSKYRDYARLYVPKGSALIKAEQSGDLKNKLSIDQGVEEGKQWFGTFIMVDPGHTKSLSFSYLLPKILTDNIKNGHYDLTVQKQIGTMAPQLTLHLDFGKNLLGAQPGEGYERHGDTVYDYVADLKVDKRFAVTLEER